MLLFKITLPVFEVVTFRSFFVGLLAILVVLCGITLIVATLLGVDINNIMQALAPALERFVASHKTGYVVGHILLFAFVVILITGILVISATSVYWEASRRINFTLTSLIMTPVGRYCIRFMLACIWLILLLIFGARVFGIIAASYGVIVAIFVGILAVSVFIVLRI